MGRSARCTSMPAIGHLHVSHPDDPAGRRLVPPAADKRMQRSGERRFPTYCPRMLRDAEEFVRLRTSDDPGDYHRAAHEEASLDTWLDVVARYPEMRLWVAQNKTVPNEILVHLTSDKDPQVRSMVARKRKLEPSTLEELANDPDDSVRMSVAQTQEHAALRPREACRRGSLGRGSARCKRSPVSARLCETWWALVTGCDRRPLEIETREESSA